MRPSISNRKTRRPTPIVTRQRTELGKRVLKHVLEFLSRAWQQLQQQQKRRLAGRSLRLEESISLGQKRSIAVIRLDNQRFLIGVSSEISLLASLETETDFGKALMEAATGAEGARAKACA